MGSFRTCNFYLTNAFQFIYFFAANLKTFGILNDDNILLIVKQVLYRDIQNNTNLFLKKLQGDFGMLLYNLGSPGKQKSADQTVRMAKNTGSHGLAQTILMILIVL